MNGLDGNGLLKTYAHSMEDKMAAGTFGRARNYGWDSPYCLTDEFQGYFFLAGPRQGKSEHENWFKLVTNLGITKNKVLLLPRPSLM